MGGNVEILEALSEATPAFRRYARALGAGAAAAVTDGVVQSALQSVGARIQARELRPIGPEEARLEAYVALTAIAARKLTVPGKPRLNCATPRAIVGPTRMSPSHGMPRAIASAQIASVPMAPVGPCCSVEPIGITMPRLRPR